MVYVDPQEYPEYILQPYGIAVFTVVVEAEWWNDMAT
jgi:hypothetical protein